jgi:dihydroflavonol-4-reductase
MGDVVSAFVTGATGFIGGRLIEALLERGVEVKALARDREKAFALQKLGIETITGDITDRASIKGALKGCDVLYQLGNVASWWLKDKSIYYKVNVDGTKSIMLEALDAGVKKVVYTSSLAAIRQPRGEIATEETRHKRDFESHYGRSKFLAEREILEIHREKGLPVIILNPGVVMGPGDLKTFGRTIIDLLNGRLKVRFFEDSMIPIVYIDDVVKGHILAVEKGRIGDRYILVGDNISIGNLFKLINRIAGAPIPDRQIPPSLIKFIAHCLEVRSFFTGRPPKFAVDGLKAMEVGAAGSSNKAKRELGLSFTPLEEGFKKTIDWYKTSGYIF